MYLVSHHKPGSKISQRRALTPPESVALLSWNVSGTTNPLALRVAQEAWETRQWIACDCNQDHPIPLLYVRRITITGKYVLANVPERGHHHPSCPFHRVSKPADSPEKSGDVTQKKIPPLGRILNTLIETAKANILAPGAMRLPRFMADQYAAIRRAAGAIDLAPGINAAEFFTTHENGLPAIAAILRKRAHEWPNTHQPQGLILLSADSVDTDQMCVVVKRGNEAHKLKVYGNISRHPLVHWPAHGPYLVLFQVAETIQNPGRYEPINALVQPVYSKQSLIPVMSNEERVTLKLLLKLQEWWARSKNMSVTIEVPLIHINASKERPPSFLLHTEYHSERRTVRVISVKAADMDKVGGEDFHLTQIVH